MITAGVDIGAGTTKEVLLEDGTRVLHKHLSRTGMNLKGQAAQILGEALSSTGLSRESISYVTTTGFGRYQLPDRDIQATDITCHARGAHFLFPETRCVIDIGAQCSRTIKVKEGGRVEKFKMNDRCAAGAGRFLERVARYLDVKVEDLGRLSFESKEPQPISSVCAVLAETEIINLVTLGKSLEDIIMGAHLSIADRVFTLLRQIGIEPQITLTGSVSLNPGMIKALEMRTNMKVNCSKDSPYAGALGAAILGYRRMLRKNAPTSPVEPIPTQAEPFRQRLPLPESTHEYSQSGGHAASYWRFFECQ